MALIIYFLDNLTKKYRSAGGPDITPPDPYPDRGYGRSYGRHYGSPTP